MSRRQMKKALARAWDQDLTPDARSKAARELAQLALALSRDIDERVRTAMKAHLPRQRTEA